MGQRLLVAADGQTLKCRNQQADIKSVSDQNEGKVIWMHKRFISGNSSVLGEQMTHLLKTFILRQLHIKPFYLRTRHEAVGLLSATLTLPSTVDVLLWDHQQRNCCTYTIPCSFQHVLNSGSKPRMKGCNTLHPLLPAATTTTTTAAATFYFHACHNILLSPWTALRRR